MNKGRNKSHEPVSLPDDPTGREPIDEDVQLPAQVRRAAAIANALSTDQPVVPIPEPKRSRSKPKITLADAEIDAALQSLDGGQLKISGPHSSTVVELVREGARHIKARRLGARQPRKISNDVTRRKEAILQAYRELTPKRQAHPTGTQTVRALRRSVIEKLNLSDDDYVVSYDLILHDIQQLGPILGLVRKGIVPPPGPKPVGQDISEKTRQEMKAGKRAVARAASARKPRTKPTH